MKLLSKKNIAAIKLASTDDKRPALQGLHVCENYTEATNGNVLARISYPYENPDDFPTVEGFTANKDEMAANYTEMSLTACHLNDSPLRLADLLAADDFNFSHDVCGIDQHTDRETGKLKDCFCPRFAARQ